MLKNIYRIEDVNNISDITDRLFNDSIVRDFDVVECWLSTVPQSNRNFWVMEYDSSIVFDTKTFGLPCGDGITVLPTLDKFYCRFFSFNPDEKDYHVCYISCDFLGKSWVISNNGIDLFNIEIADFLPQKTCIKRSSIE